MVNQDYPVEYSKLHLPRILCLHGGGTNSTIFRLQCRVIERQLQSAFRLVYAEAPFSSQAGPDVLSVYKDYGPFKAWLRNRQEYSERDPQCNITQINESIQDAMRTDDLKGATGEFVVLLGFSQGAKICASMLLAQQLRAKTLEKSIWPHFRFAVLLAGRGPFVWLTPDLVTPEGLDDATHLSTSESDDALYTINHVLQIPTIHVHGLRDPGLNLHRNLLEQFCDPSSAILLEWDGVHRVPIKTKDVSAVVEQILFLARKTGVLCF